MAANIDDMGQILATNALNNKMTWKANKRWSFSFSVGWGINPSLNKIMACYEM